MNAAFERRGSAGRREAAFALMDGGRRPLLAIVAALALWGCTKPPPVDPELVQVSTSTDHPVILAGKAGEVVLKIDVEALQPPRAVRPPLNLAIVIDTSGSMEGKPIDDAKEAVTNLLGRLHDGDFAVLVGFGSVATVLGKGTWEDGSTPAGLVEAVDKIEAAGTTDMRAALVAAFDETAPRRDAGHLSRVILLSDGKPNDATGLLEMGGAAASQAMPIVAFGLGIEFDETLLSEMARTSGGNYAFLSGSDQIAERFQQEVLKLETLVARNVSVEVVPGPGIEVLEVAGWDDLSPDRSVVVSLGDLVGGRKREVMLRLAHGERSHDARVELADVRLRYLDSFGGSGFQEHVFYVGIRASEDPAEVDSVAVETVAEALATVRANVTAMRAAEAMRQGDIDRARQTLDDGILFYRNVHREDDDAVLTGREEYARMSTLRQAVDHADAEVAARAREQAQQALDANGVGAVTVPGGVGDVRGSGSLGTATASGGPMPASPPPAPYQFSDDESESILEVHSEAYEGMYGN